MEDLWTYDAGFVKKYISYFRILGPLSPEALSPSLRIAQFCENLLKFVDLGKTLKTL